MEAPDDDKEVNSLEDPDTSAQSSGISNSSKTPEDPNTTTIAAPPKKEKINQRLQNLITRVNIYLLLFILIVVLAGGIVFIGMQRSKREIGDTNLGTQQLTPEELEKINGSDAKVGDPKQTLTIESNSIFTGKVLVRDSLDVAGEIKVGSGLNVPGLTVAGLSTFGQVAANELTVAGSASIQGQLNAQGNLAVTGSASFGGPVSAPQMTIQSLRINGDLELNRHIDAGGSTPGKSNGSALGSGGTSSISGTDTAGTLAINTGSGPGAGCFATMTFSQPFNSTPHVVVSPVGSAGGSINYYVNRSSTSFSICTSNPPPSGASFSFDYIVID
jgi:cytoskeletal protein CcmA (bactofilin family)